MKCQMALLMLTALPGLVGADVPSAWHILEDSKVASGGGAWDSVGSLQTKGTLTFGGTSGQLTSYQDLANAKFRNDVALGPLRQSTGFDGKRGWTLDSNGDVAPHDSASEQAADRTEAYLAARDYWFPNRWPATVTARGDIVDGRSRYEVLRIEPRGGEPFRMWIDAASRRINRVILEGKFNKEVTSYADYRDVHGLAVPFRISVTTGPSDSGQTITVSQVTVNQPLAVDRYEMPKQHLADYAFTPNARSAEIPFRFVGNHIYLAAEINGHHFQFGLDTGGMNIITPTVAQAIGVRTGGSAQASGVGDKRFTVSFARIPAVSLGSKLTLHNQLFVVVPLPGINAVEGIPLDGVVGYELLKRFVIRIDYASQRLQILPPADLEARSAGTAVPFTFDGRMPQVAGSLDGLTGRFDVDTGSRDVLSMNSPFVKSHSLLRRYDPTPLTVVGWGAGGASYGKVARAREFRLGEVSVPCPLVALSTQAGGTDAERSVAGVIGNGLLRRFTVTFDYPRQLMYLRRGRGGVRSFDYDRAGMWVNRLNHSFIVASVMAGGPAQRAGLRKDDLIVSVDGKDTGTLQLAAFRRTLESSPAGTKVDLKLDRAAGMVQAVVTLRDLIPGCKQIEQ